jgi:hypothetical protein
MPDKGVRYPKCPHCGGQHWGQRFDDCPYVALLSDLPVKIVRQQSDVQLAGIEETA